MLLKSERQQIVDYGKKIVEDGFTLGTGGNLSIYNPEEKAVAISPSGMPLNKMTVNDIVIIDLEGNVIEGNHKPSSEWEMHVQFYAHRQDIKAVLHAHTIYSTAFAVNREPIPASHYMLAVCGKDVPVAEYASFGSPDLAKNAFKAMKDRKAVLLANHGILTGEKDMANAFNVLEEVEYVAKVHILASVIGKPKLISDEEMNKMADEFVTYGKIAESYD